MRKVELIEEELAEIAKERMQLEQDNEKHARTLRHVSKEIEETKRKIEEKKSSSEDTSRLEERLRYLEWYDGQLVCSLGNEIIYGEEEIKRLDRRTQELTALYSSQAKEALQRSLVDVRSKEQRRQHLEDSLLPRILQLIDQFVKARQEEDRVKRLHGAILDKFKSSGQTSDQEINDMEQEVKDKGSSFWREHPDNLPTDEARGETCLFGVEEPDKSSASDSIRRIERFLTELYFTKGEREQAPSSIQPIAEEDASPKKENRGGPETKEANL